MLALSKWTLGQQSLRQWCTRSLKRLRTHGLTHGLNMTVELMSPRTTVIVLTLTVCVLLLSSCSLSPRMTVILDPTIPHRLAEEIDVVVWARLPDGTSVKQERRLLPGDMVASQSLFVTPPKSAP